MPAQTVFRGAERTRTAVYDFSGCTGTASAALGIRLAGLADGEGHFGIARVTPRSRGRGIYNRSIGTRYVCVFVIKMRADDRPMLERLATATGLGRIYSSNTVPTPGRANKPAVQWRIQKQADCFALVDIFEAHPLWSKKAREFEIWAKAVRYWATGDNGTWRGWAPMAAWFEEIRAVRAYASNKEKGA